MVVQAEAINLVEETPFRWRIEPVGQMSVPGIVFASRSLLPDVRLPALMDQLDRRTPRGVGPGGIWHLRDEHELNELLRGGSRFAVERGRGTGKDLDHCEDHGFVADADPAYISEHALRRGFVQVGSLGSGNHFLEVQVVDTIYDEVAASGFGLSVGAVCVMIHCGSRGLGHQICSDHVQTMLEAMPRYGIKVPDPQLACVPVRSPEGEAYLGAMAAAANYGRANRQILTVATRALPPGHPELPADLKALGQPVLVPGSMGTASHVMAGVSDGGAFHSTCHGAGRTMSRHAATRKIKGRDLRAQLAAQGIEVRAHSDRGLAEEAPFSYKDVDEVVATCERAGLARRVARLRPVGVVKG